MAVTEKFADEKLAGELLSDDELDNVAGGAGAMLNNVGNQRNIMGISQNNNLSNVRYGDTWRTASFAFGDERDNVNPACMSAAFINGEITGGEDF